LISPFPFHAWHTLAIRIFLAAIGERPTFREKYSYLSLKMKVKISSILFIYAYLKRKIVARKT
jgi:hypothetical protein